MLDISGIPADIILCNANIITLDEKRPGAELVAVSGNKIIGVGGNDDLEKYKGANTKIIDCCSQTIIPGFNDAHCHPLSFAATLLYIDCSPSKAANISEIQALIRSRAKKTPPGKWVRAAKYDEKYLDEKRPPTRWELDEVSPDNPVILIHYTGNSCVLNSLALKHTGIYSISADPQGGHIGREPNSREPNGIITGRNELVEKRVPGIDQEELKACVKLATEQLLSFGITSVQDTGWNNNLGHWQTLKRLKDNGQLPVRVSMMIGTNALEEFQDAGLSMGTGDSNLRIGGIKIALDESTGNPNPPQEELDYYSLKAHEAGFRIAFHVHDIVALETTLASLEYICKKTPRPDHRHRLEHCAICPPGLMRRLKATEAMVITQPAFLLYFGESYIDAVPSKKFSWLFPLGSLSSLGLKTAVSSDAPLIPCNPLTGISAAVARKTETDKIIAPLEAVSPLEALRMYTYWGAYASFEENIKGSISPGKLADLVVLSEDPTRTSSESIPGIKFVLTMVDGKIVWQA
jgi:hypothetical protein